MFENYIRNEITNRYKIMCYIGAHYEQKPSSVDEGSSGSGNALPSNATTEALVSLSETFDFINCWLK